MMHLASDVLHGGLGTQSAEVVSPAIHLQAVVHGGLWQRTPPVGQLGMDGITLEAL
jgi:hypothetical protein